MSIILGSGANTNGINLSGNTGNSSNVISSGSGPSNVQSGVSAWRTRPSSSSVWLTQGSTTVTNATAFAADLRVGTSTIKSEYLIYFNFSSASSSQYLKMRFGYYSAATFNPSLISYYQSTTYSSNTDYVGTNEDVGGRYSSLVDSVNFDDGGNRGIMGGANSSGVIGYIYLNTPGNNASYSGLNIRGKYSYKLSTTADGLGNATFADIAAGTNTSGNPINALGFYMSGGATFSGTCTIMYRT